MLSQGAAGAVRRETRVPMRSRFAVTRVLVVVLLANLVLAFYAGLGAFCEAFAWPLLLFAILWLSGGIARVVICTRVRTRSLWFPACVDSALCAVGVIANVVAGLPLLYFHMHWIE